MRWSMLRKCCACVTMKQSQLTPTSLSMKTNPRIHFTASSHGKHYAERIAVSYGCRLLIQLLIIVHFYALRGRVSG